MRSKVSILASFTILAFLAVIALAVNWDNPESQTADEMLSSGETPTYANTGPIPTPKEVRAQYERVSQAQASPAPSEVSEVPAAESTLSVKGTWSLQLLGENFREVSVTLFQSGNAIFGTRSASQGKTSLEATASGSVNGSRMDLDIITLKSITLYRATLTLAGDSASGSYEAFSASGNSWTGEATGRRTVPSG
jgi:hypothetical protein